MKEKVFLILIALLSVAAGRVYGHAPVNLGGAYTPEDIPEAYTYSIDSLAFYIDSHYDEEKQKVQAVYTWITHNMKYNVYTTFTSRNEVYSEAKELRTTLRTREGVCRQFALLFTRIVEKMGIPAFVVNGYNKSNDGTIMPEPHDWCSAKIGSEWYLYDPTFGMGYVKNYQFVSAPSMKYCHVTPREFIRNHMPYDPIWQLLEHPYPYQEFDNGTFRISPDAPVCHFNDSIRTYVRQSRIQQLASTCNRVLRNGRGNRLIDYFLQLTQSNISVYHQKEIYNIYNEALKMQNQGCDFFNEFIRYRKMAFKPKKEEGEVRQMLQRTIDITWKAVELLRTARNVPQQYASALNNLQNSITDLQEKTTMEMAFVDKYYQASSAERKSMLRRAK